MERGNVVRVGVISDTHGSISIAVKAIKQMGKIDALIHAGDYYSDALRIGPMLGVPVYAVPGNCDALCQEQDELVLKLGGCKILVTHGHFYQVKHTFQSLNYRAQELEVQVAVFGHTHVPANICENNVRLFNPGSTSRPPAGLAASYGILKIGPACTKGEIYALPD